MSDKPSLYVVEKKEVVILVILFVLVTVLAFTMGVRYGESVGKKAAREQTAVEEEMGASETDKIGGKLGDPSHDSETKAGDKHASDGGAKDSHDSPGEKPAAAAGHGETTKPEAAAAHDSHGVKPEVAAKASSKEPEKSASPAKESVEKDSDEFLLNALKDSGVEPPGGKTPGNQHLPQNVKKAQSGSYVIQVGSHPTRNEAESQLRALKAKKVDAEILPPFKDKQGEWHRVVISGYKTKREAEKEATNLKGRRVIVSFFVWRLP